MHIFLKYHEWRHFTFEFVGIYFAMWSGMLHSLHSALNMRRMLFWGSAFLVSNTALVWGTGPNRVIPVRTSLACGIVGYVGEEDKDAAVGYILEGLTILQNRGYDSVGLSTLHRSPDGSIEMKTTKFASKGTTSNSLGFLADKAPSIHENDIIGIGHTRWATHGAKTDENAHPHSDYKDRICIVHNGTIENCNELREELIARGIPFRSQTDTEVIANMIGSYLDEGLGTLESVRSALQHVEGTWGLCILSKDDPDRIIVARNGSPLVVGIAKDRMFIGSETTAFVNHTNQYISLHDGEIAIVTANSVSLDMSRKEEAVKQKVETSPAPFPHWTIREIYEQPAAISRSLNYGGRLDPRNLVKLGGLDANEEPLSEIKNLMISGCGTSLFAALFGAKIMRHVHSFDSVQTIDAAEISQDILNPVDGGLLVISQSGETKDVHRGVLLAQQLQVPCFSVVNSVGSLIARTTKCGVYVNAGREVAVASTKAFVTQVTALCLIAGWFSQLRNQNKFRQRHEELLASLHRLPIYAGMTLRLEDQMKELALKIKDSEDMFVLGKGFSEPIAKEGALKLKEITYIHAEGFGGGSLKHGPFALLKEGTPVILFIMNDSYCSHMITAAHEVRSRGAHTIVITDCPKVAASVADELICIPSNGPLTSLLGIIPIQLLAYHISVLRGINPDNPKNIAKVVTTD